MTAADRPTVSYEYDTAGRLMNIIQSAETFTWVYDDLARMKELKRPNGVTSTYDYDIANKISRIKHSNISGIVLEDLQYTYDIDNQVESIDSLANGALLPTAKTALAADAANRLTRFGQAIFIFDEEGQIRSKTDNQGTSTFNWDARGRLTQVTQPSGQQVRYSYDVLGRRDSRASNGLFTTYLYDGNDIVIDTNEGGLATVYLNGPRIDNKLRQSSVGTGPLYFLQDHLYSTIGLTNANGALVEKMRYEVYGNSADYSLTRYGYTGREKDSSTELMLYRARWYDPQQGRFIREDPLGIEDNINKYLYAYASPIRYSDPSGLAACFVDFPDYEITIPYLNIQTTLTPGHAGVLGYDPETGVTRYYEYGRYPPCGDFGCVERRKVPNLVIGADKKPTTESLEKLRKYLSEKLGHGTKVILTCYPDIDEQSVYEYAESIKNNPNRPAYSWYPWNSNTCHDFANDALGAGRPKPNKK
jgi:RHS repeat-associated protein